MQPISSSGSNKNKGRIESRRGVLSRKDSISKNNLYNSKNKVPDVLGNKPTVNSSIGSKAGLGMGPGAPLGSNSYFNKA